MINVVPRYSCGSPALVPAETARRVKVDELDGYRAALSGLYGDEQKARAELLGLRGIVEELREQRNKAVPVKHRSGWHVEDWLTGESYWRPHDTNYYDVYVSHSFDRPSELVARRMPLCFVAELLDRVKPVTADIRHGGGDVVAEWFQRVDGKLVRSYKYARDTERFALEYRPELTK